MPFQCKPFLYMKHSIKSWDLSIVDQLSLVLWLIEITSSHLTTTRWYLFLLSTCFSIGSTGHISLLCNADEIIDNRFLGTHSSHYSLLNKNPLGKCKPLYIYPYTGLVLLTNQLSTNQSQVVRDILHDIFIAK